MLSTNNGKRYTVKERQTPTKDKTIIASIIMTNNFMVQKIAHIFILSNVAKKQKSLYHK